MHGLFVGVVLGLVACGGAAAPPPVLEPAKPMPAPARVGFSIEPEELGDPGIVQRIRHRVRMRRFGDVYLVPDGEPLDNTRRSEADDRIDYLLPVIDQNGSKIQVVVEDDRARFAMWIESRDTWEVPLVPIRLDTAESRAESERGRAGDAARSGIFIEPGAKIDVGPKGPRRSIGLRDSLLDVRGWLDASKVGRVFVVGVDDPHPLDMIFNSTRTRGTWKYPADKRPVMSVLAATAIHVAPNADSAVVATAREDVDVAIVKQHGAWTEIELVREYFRMRGFVPARALVESSGIGHIGTFGHGSGFGMSHADRVVVPAGTCLYGAIDGHVVGVQLEEQERLGRLRTQRPGWSLVHVNTPWHHTQFYVHDNSDEPDVTKPVWETCRKPD